MLKKMKVNKMVIKQQRMKTCEQRVNYTFSDNY